MPSPGLSDEGQEHRDHVQVWLRKEPTLSDSLSKLSREVLRQPRAPALPVKLSREFGHHRLGCMNSAGLTHPKSESAFVVCAVVF